MERKLIKIYLASSFAYTDKALTEERKAMMKQIQDYLTSEEFYHDHPTIRLMVYNPSLLKIKDAWDYSYWDWGELVYEEDKKKVNWADLVLFISYGKENNAGSVWEDGYACGIGKPVLLVSMDKNSPESLMTLHSAYACIDGFEGLKNYSFELMPRTRVERIES